MSDSDESTRASKSFVKMCQPAQPYKFDTFKKPDESVIDCVRRISNGDILFWTQKHTYEPVTQSNDDLKREQFCNTGLQWTLD